MIAENIQKIGLYYLFSGAVLNVSLNFILIEQIGINGAAIATIISLVSIVLFFPLFNKAARRSVGMFFSAFDIIRIFKWAQK